MRAAADRVCLVGVCRKRRLRATGQSECMALHGVVRVAGTHNHRVCCLACAATRPASGGAGACGPWRTPTVRQALLCPAITSRLSSAQPAVALRLSLGQLGLLPACAVLWHNLQMWRIMRLPSVLSLAVVHTSPFARCLAAPCPVSALRSLPAPSRLLNSIVVLVACEHRCCSRAGWRLARPTESRVSRCVCCIPPAPPACCPASPARALLAIACLLSRRRCLSHCARVRERFDAEFADADFVLLCC